MAKKGSKTSETKLPKNVTVRHVRAPDFNTIFTDGAFLTVRSDTLTLTFYTEDHLIKSQSGKLADKSTGRYNLTEFDEETIRTQQVAIRMKGTDAAALTMSILERLKRDIPSAVQGISFQVKQD